MTYRPLLTRWLPVILRAIAVVIIFPQMLNKFTNPELIAGYFQQLNIPAPEIMVYVVGIIELVAVISYALGAAGRWVAIIVIIEMVVAMLTAGPNQNNIIVFLCSVGIALLGTGALSLWKPAEPRLLREPETSGS
ncbi:MAG: DoxX family protein [Chloroflexota bacterium]|nr:MAG: hypothetical protein DIU68_13060 [Chloroflexota bacterium]